MARVSKGKHTSRRSTNTAKPSRIPKRLRVGFRFYNVKTAVPKGDYYGCCVFERSEIHIRDNIGSEERKSTVFHEYCHAKMHDGGLRDIFTARQEETICQFFSQAVMELIRDPDNWKMLEWAKMKEKDKLPPVKIEEGPNY